MGDSTTVQRARMSGALLLTAAAWLTGPALAQEAAVSPSEIKDTWVGKELVGTTASGAAATMRLDAGGKASISAGTTSDTGTWRLSDTGYCTTWSRIRAGQERCFTVTRTGSTLRVFNPDGSLSGQFTSIR